MERSRHGSTAGQVRKAIRADIQTGVFPAGSRLTSEMLAERYRVSRTPVREALIRLEEDGLVCGTPNAGYELRQPTIAELCEIYELREALEGLAIERTIRTGVPPELLKELRQACELRRNSSVNGELEAGDFAFHRAICRHCGSAALRGIIDNTLLLSTVFAVAPKLFRADRGRTDREHEAIVQAVADGDAKRARRLLTNHIAAARKRLEKLAK
ncbi:GntR family transcriptional regulator [Victivallaceae bacterium BBE-744-WT-12]|jgi:transcriptional regulator, gntR family|uniref:GntR family transcriptional regulator n=1 Tax=Victivallis lenta TaxID=2606640 RepID=A0A844FXZ1_9BACT|nr:GntR family transcriptional regulator [Victivallis lenta]MST95604.1 GntR family transcriptional regulator [Victivallis lenta]HBP07562.1 hypothetical protein [Lentisphaeria bacterium]HCH83888.1 hypothetical protein [Lentisphaeria bacterium]